jgi:hypothetical protein
MTSPLVRCSTCKRHIYETETSCPFCARAAISTPGSLAVALTAAAGLALAGCANDPPKTDQPTEVAPEARKAESPQMAPTPAPTPVASSPAPDPAPSATVATTASAPATPPSPPATTPTTSPTTPRVSPPAPAYGGPPPPPVTAPVKRPPAAAYGGPPGAGGPGDPLR